MIDAKSAIALGVAGGAIYYKTKQPDGPNREPWNPAVDSQTHYDYIVLGGINNTLS